jgi:thiol:disulfide interchange protein
MRAIYAFLLSLVAMMAFAQAPKPVKWEARLEPADARAGEAAMLVVTATIDAPYYIYGLFQAEEISSTELILKEGVLKADGDPVMPFAPFKTDPNLKVDYAYFEGQVAFGVPVKIPAGTTGEQKGTLIAKFQACTTENCLIPEDVTVPYTFNVPAGAARSDRTESLTEAPAQPAGYIDPDKKDKPAPTEAPKDAPKDAPKPAPDAKAASRAEANQPLGAFLLTAILAGLGALLTPCVFPMIPVTVSYFSKRAEKGESRFAGPLAYSLGMIATFAVVGILFAVTIGATGLNRFATHPTTNIALGVLFVVLALNLFGLYEIQLPSSLVNKANQGRTKGGLVGPFMMGLAFSLTSFTCTVGFVGLLLGLASQGDLIRPALGLTVFGATFAAPFFLLALFPTFLAKMPRSGAWMQTTKHFMGFLELAAAMKFFQNAEIVMDKGWLTREVFLAIWAIIFAAAGFFMLGWLILPKEYGTPIGWVRRGFGVAMVGLAAACLMGIGGTHLRDVEAFLPPKEYGKNKTAVESGEVAWKKDDYEGALQEAKATGKYVIVDFTGYT